MRHHRNQDFFLGAMAGGVVAALTTLLFTTKAGKKLQNEVIEKYQELEDGVKTTFSDSKDKVEEAAHTAKKAVSKKD